MNVRIASLAGLSIVALSSLATAQQDSIPLRNDYRPKAFVPAQPALHSDSIFTIDEAQKSHPQQIQSQLKRLAEQFAAAGLVDEARIVQELERRVQTEHFPRLLAAHKLARAKAIESQISLHVKMIEFRHSPEMTAAISQLLGPAAGDGDFKASNNPDATRPISGIFEATKASAWIDDMNRQGLLKVLSSPQITVLDGRTARVQHGSNFIVPSSGRNRSRQEMATDLKMEASGDNADDSRFVGESLNVTAKVQPDKLISLSLTANHKDVEGTSRRVQCEIELREGQTFVIAGLQSLAIRTEVTRIPVLGDLPFVGRVFSSKKSFTDTNVLMFVVTPEIIVPPDDNDVPAVPSFEVAPVQPAAFTRPVK